MIPQQSSQHYDDVITLKHSLYYWIFMGESISNWWIPWQRPGNAEWVLMFSLSLVCTSYWTNKENDSDFRRHDAHITVMTLVVTWHIVKSLLYRHGFKLADMCRYKLLRYSLRTKRLTNFQNQGQFGSNTNTRFKYFLQKRLYAISSHLWRADWKIILNICIRLQYTTFQWVPNL